MSGCRRVQKVIKDVVIQRGFITPYRAKLINRGPIMFIVCFAELLSLIRSPGIEDRDRDSRISIGASA